MVGKDQVPHLELCNDVAKRVGGREYKYELSSFDKVASLKDPTKKMSKTLGDKHVLYLFNEDYLGKLRKANSNELGIGNLKRIAQEFGITKEYESNLELKNDLAVAIHNTFS